MVRQAGRAIGQVAAGKRQPGPLAQFGLAVHAVKALTALRQPGEHHMIAHRQIGDARTELNDRPGALVAQDDGHRVV
jgi:hypothetical protein